MVVWDRSETTTLHFYRLKKSQNLHSQMFYQDATYSRKIFLIDSRPARGEVSIKKSEKHANLQLQKTEGTVNAQLAIAVQ